MKKLLFSLVLALLLLLSKTDCFSKGLSDLGERGFCRLLKEPWARQVFDVDREEAVAVFGEESEAYFL